MTLRKFLLSQPSLGSTIQDLLNELDARKLDLTDRLQSEMMRHSGGGFADIFRRKLDDGTIIAEKVIRYFGGCDDEKTAKITKVCYISNETTEYKPNLTYS